MSRAIQDTEIQASDDVSDDQMERFREKEAWRHVWTSSVKMTASEADEAWKEAMKNVPSSPPSYHPYIYATFEKPKKGEFEVTRSITVRGDGWEWSIIDAGHPSYANDEQVRLNTALEEQRNERQGVMGEISHGYTLRDDRTGCTFRAERPLADFLDEKNGKIKIRLSKLPASSGPDMACSDGVMMVSAATDLPSPEVNCPIYNGKQSLQAFGFEWKWSKRGTDDETAKAFVNAMTTLSKIPAASNIACGFEYSDGTIDSVWEPTKRIQLSGLGWVWEASGGRLLTHEVGQRRLEIRIREEKWTRINVSFEETHSVRDDRLSIASFWAVRPLRGQELFQLPRHCRRTTELLPGVASKVTDLMSP